MDELTQPAIPATPVPKQPPADPKITIDDFAKVQIKMGKILAAERIEGSDKLLKLSVDLGEAAPRTICSGIAQYYSPEDMIGKMVPVITNLAPRKMRGIESNGMVLFGIDETVIPGVDGAESKPGHVPVMLNSVKEVPPGSPVA
jgi:methionyl-tRNA synthetase